MATKIDAAQRMNVNGQDIRFAAEFFLSGKADAAYLTNSANGNLADIQAQMADWSAAPPYNPPA